MSSSTPSRCVGETKFFTQCPRLVVGESPAFCWEHAPQATVRIREAAAGATNEVWMPMGAFDPGVHTLPAPSAPGRLRKLVDDEQNVHTPEVQSSVARAVKTLHAWAAARKIKTERDIVSVIKKTANESNSTTKQALDHLRSCYDYNDDTLMFGVTYPMLVTWVWHRIMNDEKNRELLLDRFFEEVRDSAGQCLNGNMSRLMNVFAAIDEELSPQDSTQILSRDALPLLVAKAVDDPSKSVSVLVNEVQSLLSQANVPAEEWGGWIDAVLEARE